MLSPIKTVFIYYPLRAFVTVVSMILVSILAYKYLIKKYKDAVLTKQKGIALWLLINYSILLLFFTVLGRRSLDYYRYNFNLGYSYQEVLVLGDYTLASQILINVFMFIPIGIIASFVVDKYVVISSLIYGATLSFVIEVLQLVLRRGYCELDDLLSNIIGTLIGCALITLCDFFKNLERREKE